MMVTRREMLAALGAAWGRSAVHGFPAIAQPRPLRVGALISRADAQGQAETIEPYDQQMRLGLDLAIAEINAGGGILGRRVELLVAGPGLDDIRVVSIKNFALSPHGGCPLVGLRRSLVN